MKPITDEHGNKLYGYSQIDLERTNKLLSALIILLGILTLVIIFFGYWIDKNNIITQLVA